MKNKIRSFFDRNYYSIAFLLMVLGFSLGLCGFLHQEQTFGNALYKSFKLLTFGYSFTEDTLHVTLHIARWILLLSCLLISFRLFIAVVIPKIWTLLVIRLRYKNHIIICGLNDMALYLMNKYREENEKTQIVVIAKENSPNVEYLRHKNVKVITGESTDKQVLESAKLTRATKLFAVANDDKTNVDIAQTTFLILKKRLPKLNQVLKCYTLIKDAELKNILEETALFKYSVADGERAHEKYFFDGVLINIRELGVKYEMNVEIGKILPQNTGKAPSYLIIGLTDIAEHIMNTLAHGLTMNRENFVFTIVEKDKYIPSNKSEKSEKQIAIKL